MDFMAMTDEELVQYVIEKHKGDHAAITKDNEVWRKWFKLSDELTMKAWSAYKDNHTEITCCDCGKGRWIKPQDVFQVKRCEGCQVKFRRKLDGMRRKAKRAKSGHVWLDGRMLVRVERKDSDTYLMKCYSADDTYSTPIWDITITDGEDHTVHFGDRAAVQAAYNALDWFKDGRWDGSLR